MPKFLHLNMLLLYIISVGAISFNFLILNFTFNVFQITFKEMIILLLDSEYFCNIKKLIKLFLYSLASVILRLVLSRVQAYDCWWKAQAIQRHSHGLSLAQAVVCFVYK